MPEYISIAEFAERAGVTRQSAYRRLDKELQRFVREVDGRKTIDVAALDEYVPQSNNRSSCSATVSETTEATAECSATTVSATNEAVSATERFTSYLEKENERLRNDVADKDALLASYADRFAALAEREQEISARALATTGQAQLLHANTQEDAVDPPRGNWFTRRFK